MKNEIIKVAFVGGGINSAVGYAHYSAINMDNGFELVAGCFSRNKDINYASAEKYRVSADRVYNNLDELIREERDRIDAVIILTPQNQHYSHVLKFISEGVPVICEKSLAASVEEVVEIKKAVERKSGFLSVIYNYLGYPVIRELKHLINNGDLGKIIHVQIEMPQEGFIRVNDKNKPVVPQKWRLNDGSIPTISLDLGVHLHMLVKYLVNEHPIKLIAISESLGNFSTVVDNVNCIIKYSNDIVCNLWYSKIAIGSRNGMKIRVFGNKGSAEWTQEFPEVLKLADRKGRRWTLDRGNNEVDICNQQRYNRFKVGHPAGYIEALANYYCDIAYAMKNGSVKSENHFGVDEAYEGILLMNAIQKSTQLNTWMEVK